MLLNKSTTLKSKLCERLKQARMQAGFTTAKAFAVKHDLKISTYSLHEAGTRSMALEVIEHYATLLDLNTSWLLTGMGSKNSSLVRQVPIIDWEHVVNYPQGIAFDLVKWTTSDIDLSPFSFALIVDNDAMEPRYPEGTIIIVDNQQKPKIKDYALILLKEKKVPVFKQLIQVDGTLYAKSLNPEYKAIRLSKSAQVLGKIMQAKLILEPV
ncbi:MAG: LexA family transcriptional regulator [Proteobacteria bacterium]|nr:LexA family transcriptional regulator [Pseudomonadota bacterium]